MKYIVPGYKKPFVLDTLILDLNGTMSIDGKCISYMKDKIIALQKSGWTIILCSGDTQGTASNIAKDLGATLHICKDQNDKAKLLKKYTAKHRVAIGNGNIDTKLMKKCKISIAVIQAEGCSYAAIKSSDIVCTHIGDALDILLLPKRLIATLRK